MKSFSTGAMVLCGFLVLGSACDDGNGIAPVDADLSRPGTYRVASTTRTLIDTYRPTPPANTYPGAPSRTIVTEVWYPSVSRGIDTPMDLGGAPYPLVVLGHGFMGSRTLSSFLTEHLASYGYVVAAPDFPLSHFGSPSGPTAVDYLNQPGDISYILDRMIAFSQEAGNLFSGGIDTESIGIIGHSMGGMTTILVTFDSELLDDRVDAAIPLAPLACPFTEETFRNRSVPVLFIGGSADIFCSWDDNLKKPYDRAGSPKYMVTIVNGSHIGFTNFNFTDAVAIESLFSVEFGQSEEEIQAWEDLFEYLGDPEPCGDLNANPAENEIENLPETVIEPGRQRELANIFTTAFFELYLKGRDEYEYFFSSGYTGDIPDITFESDT